MVTVKIKVYAFSVSSSNRTLRPVFALILSAEAWKKDFTNILCLCMSQTNRFPCQGSDSLKKEKGRISNSGLRAHLCLLKALAGWVGSSIYIFLHGSVKRLCWMALPCVSQVCSVCVRVGFGWIFWQPSWHLTLSLICQKMWPDDFGAIGYQYTFPCFFHVSALYLCVSEALAGWFCISSLFACSLICFTVYLCVSEALAGWFCGSINVFFIFFHIFVWSLCLCVRNLARWFCSSISIFFHVYYGGTFGCRGHSLTPSTHYNLASDGERRTLTRSEMLSRVLV